MREPDKTITDLPPGYDPARANRLRELGEQLIAASDPQEIDRLKRELRAFLIGTTPDHLANAARR
jgi:hypothetical protein